MDKGFLGDIFDVNHDGELDGFERTLEDAGLDPDDYDF